MTLAWGSAYRLPFVPPAREHRSAAGRQADAIRCHRTARNLHRVVDGQGGANAAARRIDVKVDRLAPVFALQVQELHHQLIGVAVVDFALQENDPVLQQQIPQRQLAAGADSFDKPLASF